MTLADELARCPKLHSVAPDPRRDLAKHLRVSKGMTYPQIARELGVSLNTAWKWCRPK